MSVVYYALCVVRTSLPVKRQNGVLSLPEEMRFWLLVHSVRGHDIANCSVLLKAEIPLYA